jgi:hypothetical protein
MKLRRRSAIYPSIDSQAGEALRRSFDESPQELVLRATNSVGVWVDMLTE